MVRAMRVLFSLASPSGLRPRNKPPLTGAVAERQRCPEGLYRVHSTSYLSPSISTHATASGSIKL